MTRFQITITIRLALLIGGSDPSSVRTFDSNPILTKQYVNSSLHLDNILYTFAFFCLLRYFAFYPRANIALALLAFIPF